MSKSNQPIRKPSLDAMEPRPSGRQGWQLNLRQDQPSAPPKYLLDLRQPAQMKEQRFFEFLASDLRAPDVIHSEYGEDELDIDERFALWWEEFTASIALAWDRIRRIIRPRHRELGVVLAVVAFASLGALVAAAETPQLATQPLPGSSVIQAPGRGGVSGQLPGTGAGGWLAILENYLKSGNYKKLTPESRAQPSPWPSAPPSNQAGTSLSAGTGGSGLTTSSGTSGGYSSSPGTGTSTPAPAPAPQPLQPVTQPLDPITQPVQQLTQPLTSPLGL